MKSLYHTPLELISTLLYTRKQGIDKTDGHVV